MARSTWGSIRMKSKGVWEIRYPVGGKQKSETIRDIKKNAEHRLAELRVEFGEDRNSRTRVTVRGCWLRYYLPFIKRHKALSTVSGYTSAYECHIDTAFGMREMESVRPIEVQAWLDGMTYGAARKTYAVARAMWNYAEDKDLIGKNPFSKRYELPKSSGGSARAVNGDIFSVDDLRSIFTACEGEPWEAGFILSAFGGLRREEAVGIQRGDIEFNEMGAVLRISRGVQVIDGDVAITPLKTEGSVRVVVIPEPYASRLRELVAQHPDEEWLLDDGFGEPANPDTLACSYKRWFARKPYSYIPWMNLRNSYATMLHEAGVDLGMIAKMLGHSTPTITFRHYDKPGVNAIAAAAAKLSLDT